MDLKTISTTLALLGSSAVVTACDKKPPENQRKDAAEIPVDGAQPAEGAAAAERGEGSCGEGKCGEGTCGTKADMDGAAKAVPVAPNPEGDPPAPPAPENDDDKS
jgi:hypothetical protein